MALVQVAVCDICQEVDRETTQFRIGRGDQETVLDLCNEEHAIPLNALLEGRWMFVPVTKPKKSAAKKSASPGRPPGKITVVSMDEIEKLKNGSE